MSRRSDLPGSLPLYGFSVADARAAGVSRKRTRAGDLQAPFRGVRAQAGIPESVSGRAHAYAARMPVDHFFSHATAALLFGFPLPRRIEKDPRLHVSVLSPDRAPRMAGVVGHSVQCRPGLWSVGGLTMTDPVTTWCDRAPVLALDDLIAAGDYLLGPGGPMVTSQALTDAVAARVGRRGVQRLRQALEWMRPRVGRSGRPAYACWS
jgi:hypothetical protein